MGKTKPKRIRSNPYRSNSAKIRLQPTPPRKQTPNKTGKLRLN